MVPFCLIRKRMQAVNETKAGLIPLRLILTSIVVFLVGGISCSGDDALPTLILTSPAFENGDILPRRHTCHGSAESPAIFISNAPDETVQFALALENLDATGKVKILWLIWGIPNGGYLPANLEKEAFRSKNIYQGLNQTGYLGYSSPCSPKGEHFRYRFTAYALEADAKELNRSNTISTEFYKFVQANAIAKGHITAISL